MTRQEALELLQKPGEALTSQDIREIRHIQYMLEIDPDYVYNLPEEPGPPSTVEVTAFGDRIIKLLNP